MNKGGGRGFFGVGDDLLSSPFRRGKLPAWTELVGSALVGVAGAFSPLDNSEPRSFEGVGTGDFVGDESVAAGAVVVTALVSALFRERLAGPALLGWTLLLTGIENESLGRSDWGVRPLDAPAGAAGSGLVMVDVDEGGVFANALDLSFETGLPTSGTGK